MSSVLTSFRLWCRIGRKLISHVQSDGAAHDSALSDWKNTAMERNVWYKHGDVRGGEIFCALCDMFYTLDESSHFSEYHPLDTPEAKFYPLELSARIKNISRKKRDDESFKNGKYISDADRNIFDGNDLPPEDPFYRWLKRNWESIDEEYSFGWWVLHDTVKASFFPKYLLTEKTLKRFVNGSIGPEGEDVFEYLLAIYKKYKSKEKRYIPPSLRFSIFSRDKFSCRICGRNTDDGVKLEVDHKHPVSLGGESNEGNLWTLCFDCNRGKAAKTLDGIIKK